MLKVLIGEYPDIARPATHYLYATAPIAVLRN
jgi:hypothetical protein